MREKLVRDLLLLLSLFCSLSAHGADPSDTGPRFRLENYPQLPAEVAAVLLSRHCEIPQSNREGQARNVIRGEFFRRGRKGWAVLCSSGGKSAILVFRHDHDNSPDEIAESADNRFIINIGEGRKVYLREISPVSGKFIVSHYYAYGGVKPPAVDHDGIDDAFLEKASIIWYWYKGQWVQLQGAD